jgi:hypothetical protein
MGQSVGSTSRPSPSLRIFDNDNETEALIKRKWTRRTTAIVFHTSRYSVSKDEDDDCTSFYDLDEGDEDSLLRRTKNRPLVMSLLLSGFRKHINLYSQEYKGPREIKERKAEIGTLHDSLIDLYQSPTRSTKSFMASHNW